MKDSWEHIIEIVEKEIKDWLIDGFLFGLQTIILERWNPWTYSRNRKTAIRRVL